MAKLEIAVIKKFFKGFFALLAINHIIFCALPTALQARAVAMRRGHKRLVIHVPVQVKMHHHTHTVYSHIRDDKVKTVYKILSYDKEPQLQKGFKDGHEYGGYVDGNQHTAHAYDDLPDYDEMQTMPTRLHYQRFRHGRTLLQQRHRHRHRHCSTCNDGESRNDKGGNLILEDFPSSSNEEAERGDYPDLEAFVDDITWVES